MAVTSALVDSTIRNGSSGTTSTVTGVQFGTAFSGRVVCVCFFVNSFSRNPTSVTIGGVTATRVGSIGNAYMFIASAVVPTGTSGNVVATFAASDQIVIEGVVALTGAANATPADTIDIEESPGSIDVGAGGCIVAYATSSGSGAWNGVSQLMAANVNGNSIGSFDNSGGALTNRSVGYDTGFNLVAAAFDASGGGGGGVTANPTTVAGTGAAGTPTVSGKANVTPTGNSATGAVGTPTVAVRISAAVTGVSATGAVGGPTVTGKANVTPPAATGTGAVGTPTVTGAAIVPVTGVGGTGNVGTPTTAITATASVTGVAATGAAGTPTVQGKANASLTGVGGTGQVGDVSVEAGGSVSVPLTGVQATGAVGDITVGVPASVSVELIGVGAIGQIGSIVVPQADNANEITGGGGPSYRGRHKRGKSHKQTVDEAIDRAVDKLERKSNPEAERAIVAVEAVRPIANLPVPQEAIDKVLKAINAVANVGRSAADMRSQVARLEATARQLEEIERQEREDEDAAIYLLLVA